MAAAVFPDEGYELARIAKIVFGRDFRAAVTAQGQDVFDAVLFKVLQCLQDFLFAEVDAGQVGCAFEMVFLLDEGSDPDGCLAAAAAGTAGDADEIRGQAGQCRQRAIDGLQRCISFWREDFKGKNRFWLKNRCCIHKRYLGFLFC